VASNQVPGFRPSTAGLHFPNAFPPQPDVVVSIPAIGDVPIGDAANGLCGGMVFTTRDFFEMRRAPPPDTEPPGRDNPLFHYLVKRLFDSFNLPTGPLKYYTWMNLPDADTWIAPGVRRRTVAQEWPLVRQDIDAGKPAPLGLLRVQSRNPLAMGQNHQVLAYGYQLDEASQDLTVQLYDPNHPDQDDVTLSANVADPGRQGAWAYSTGEALRGFFYTAYTPSRFSARVAAAARAAAMALPVAADAARGGAPAAARGPVTTACLLYATDAEIAGRVKAQALRDYTGAVEAAARELLAQAPPGLSQDLVLGCTLRPGRKPLGRAQFRVGLRPGGLSLEFFQELARRLYALAVPPVRGSAVAFEISLQAQGGSGLPAPYLLPVEPEAARKG
jgi:hypothetical protein